VKFINFTKYLLGGKLSNEELHSESGYLSMSDGGRFSLSTVMSNGNNAHCLKLIINTLF
jgi:hypothetical protein